MPAILGPMISTIIVIGTYVYEIGKTIYTWLIKPLTVIKEVLETVNNIIKGIISTIRGKINYVLELIGVDVLIDVVRGISFFKDRIEEIAKGHVIDLVEVLGDLYQTIATTAKEIIHFTSLCLEPIFTRLNILQTDIKNITDWKLKEVNNAITRLITDVRTWDERLVRDLKGEIERETELLKEGWAGELAGVNVRLTGVIALSEDIKHFAEMLIKVLGA